MESRKDLLITAAELSIFGSSTIAEETKNTFSVYQVEEVSKCCTFFFVHKINVQEFNSKQSYLKKI